MVWFNSTLNRRSSFTPQLSLKRQGHGARVTPLLSPLPPRRAGRSGHRRRIDARAAPSWSRAHPHPSAREPRADSRGTRHTPTRPGPGRTRTAHNPTPTCNMPPTPHTKQSINHTQHHNPMEPQGSRPILHPPIGKASGSGLLGWAPTTTTPRQWLLAQARGPDPAGRQDHAKR